MIGEVGGQGLDLTSVTMLIASGLTLTFVALSLVFGGFFAERRMRDRLEDIETRARTGSRPLQMATLRRVDKAGRLPTLDKLLWRWFPNASKIRQKLLASGMNLTLGDYAFISIAIAVALAFLLHVVLDLAPVITLAERQLEAALLADGRDYRTLNAYGVVLDMTGRHAEAQARYRQGIELAPTYLPLRSNFGLSLAISGQPQEAIAQLAPLANSRGADGRVRQNLAFAYAMNGDLENCLLVSRKDLDEQSAQRQLSYFMQLRSLPVEARSAELRRNPSFFPQSASGA
jgi:tetratricopeptide (TPR) repeat protein